MKIMKYTGVLLIIFLSGCQVSNEGKCNYDIPNQCMNINDSYDKNRCMYYSAVNESNTCLCEYFVSNVSISEMKTQNPVTPDTCGNGICEEYELLRTCPRDCKSLETNDYEICLTACNYEEIYAVKIFGTEEELDIGPILDPDFKPNSNCGVGGGQPSMCECHYCINLEEVHQPLFEIEFLYELYDGDSVCAFIVSKHSVNDDKKVFDLYPDEWIDEIDEDGGAEYTRIQNDWESDTECLHKQGAIRKRFAYFPYDNAKPWHPQIPPNISYEDQEKIEIRDSCYLEIAFKDNNENICEEIISSYPRDECYYEFGTKELDPKLCNQIESEQKFSCLQSVYLKEAIKKKDYKMCFEPYGFDEEGYPKEMDYEIAECVTNIAVNKKELEYCVVLDSGYGRVQDECYRDVAKAKKDISICDKIRIHERGECLEWFLSRTDDPEEICLEMNDSESFLVCVKQLDCEDSMNKEACRELVDKTIDNPNFCEYDTEKNDCYIKLATEFKNISYCEELRNKNWCYAKYARAVDNMKICEMIRPDWRHNCHSLFNESEILEYKFKSGVREEIPECMPYLDSDREQCYYDKALKDSNHLLCNNTGGMRSDCYRHIVIATEDPKVCEDIEDQNDKDGCLLHLVEAIGDKNYCEQIVHPGRKKGCIGD